MPPPIKRLKRGMRRGAMSLRATVAGVMPQPLHRMLAPAVRYTDMLLLDHLFIRLVFPNRHKITERAWRAAQPLPHQLKALKTLGIKTIINLRGNPNTTTHRLEKAACDRLGIALVDYKLRSRAAPSREELHGLRQLFTSVEHPILLHCKSGADRAGLASTLYLHIVEGVPIDIARHQLGLKFGHLKQADTGVLDFVFERYLDRLFRLGRPPLRSRQVEELVPRQRLGQPRCRRRPAPGIDFPYPAAAAAGPESSCARARRA